MSLVRNGANFIRNHPCWLFVVLVAILVQYFRNPGGASNKGELEEKLFDDKPEYLEKQDFDVIIIGSGMGGGTLARRLIENGKKVLLLERGGLLWTTHTLNTARPHSKHLVDPSTAIKHSPTQDSDYLYDDFRTKYEVEKGTSYKGGPVFCLGGRSAVWGLYSPVIDTDTMQKYFPQEMVTGLFSTRVRSKEYTYMELSKQYLSNNYKEEPEDKMKKAIECLLNNTLHGLESAYVASEFTTTRKEQRNPYTFPLGAYSTIDFLLDYTYNMREAEKLNSTRNNVTRSYILLHSQAIKFITKEVDGKKEITSLAVKHPARKEPYQFRAKSFVLAAGTVESYRIAYNSGLNPPPNGITDHALLSYYFTTFHLPGWKAPKFPDKAAKLQAYKQLRSGRVCLVNIAINCDLYLGRKFKEVKALLDNTTISQEHKESIINKASAIVFEFTDTLDHRNTITLQGDSTKIKMFRQDVTPDEMDELTEITGELVSALGVTILEAVAGEDDHDPAIKCKPDYASLGSVAHEVGTMPIRGPKTQNGVVDENLKYINATNLHVCDLSVFPVSPAANPSRTLVALAIRLGDHLTHILP